jgi:hypothetical protein
VNGERREKEKMERKETEEGQEGQEAEEAGLSVALSSLDSLSVGALDLLLHHLCCVTPSSASERWEEEN